MEMEFFVKPSEANQWFEYWKAQRLEWHRSLGLSEERLRFHLLDTGHTPVHPKIDPLWQAFFTRYLRGTGLKSRS